LNPEQLQDTLDFAVEVALRAGHATMQHYQTGVTTELKPDRSPVTAADRAAERLARELITARFPDDAIIGEEFGAEGSSERRWILDPIDGTRTFIRGVPFFGFLLALQVGDEVPIGVMHFPALNETVSAAHGLGCWWNAKRAHVSNIGALGDALVCTTDAESVTRSPRADSWQRLTGAAGLTRTWGDCYGYALVATGRAEAMLDATVSIWDIAAVSPIIREAGGVLTDWDGNNGYDIPSAVATNGMLAEETRRVLRGDAR